MKKNFPRNIFQVWYQGCENLKDPRFIENAKNWKNLNTNWNYYCVSDSDLKNACYKFSTKCGETYDSMDVMHMKIDFGRYVLLYLYGGIYIDMDAYVLRSLNYSKHIQKCIDLYEVQNKNVIALSRLDFLYMYEKLLNGKFNNAFMFATPENPVLKKFIENIVNNYKKDVRITNALSVTYITGPIAFNTFFENKNNLQGSDIIQLSHTIFEPYNFNGILDLTDETISIHKFELSWIPQKKLVNMYICLRDYLYIILLIIIVLWLYRNKYIILK